MHVEWIETLPCAVRDRWAWDFRPEGHDERHKPCGGDVCACHVRTDTDGGGSLKPSDWWTIPMCYTHHRHQHDIGEPAFERLYKIDMKEIAHNLASKSPDLEMRQSARLRGTP